MAKVSEGIARVASGIATSRRYRGELATQIKGATKYRRKEIHSLLQNLKATRERTSRDMMAQLRKATTTRRSEVRAVLNGLRSTRGRENRAYHDKAEAFMRDLTNGVAVLRAKFAKDDRDRAANLRQIFAEQAQDRSEAANIWRGKI